MNQKQKNKELIQIGDKFGNWVVLFLSDKRINNKKAYNCRCICGTERIVKGSRLRAGKSKSCRCQQGFAIQKHNQKLPGLASWNFKEAMYKSSAKNRNIEWELSTFDFKTICSKNCHYCNADPKAFNLYLKKDGSISSNFQNIKLASIERQWIKINGIDRLNNDDTYNLLNCAACCDFCNYMKLDNNINDFLNQCIKIVNFRKGLK